MIVFDLCCKHNHIFEAWFKDRESFEEQREKGLVVCPICGSKEVRKILSPVAIKKHSDSVRPKKYRASEGEEQIKAYEALLNRVYKYIENNTEDVGTDFAKEALKIHYGVEEPRGIRGVTTEEEEKILKEEGVSFFKFPVPSKKNKGN